MANPTGKFWGAELYIAKVFPLDSAGAYLTTPNGVLYEGLQFEGSRVFEITPAEARAIDNYGDGRLRDTLYLPPNTATKAELRVGYDHQDINAALQGVTKFTEGEKTIVPMGTNKQGSEPTVALMVVQMGHDDLKNKRYRFYMIPRAQCIPLGAGSMNENATELRYQISMSPSTVNLWNETLALGTHGCTEMAYADGMSQDRPNIVMWEGDGVYDAIITLPTDKPATNVTKMTVRNLTTGAAVVAGITKDTTSVTFITPPTYPVAVIYEY